MITGKAGGGEEEEETMAAGQDAVIKLERALQTHSAVHIPLEQG